MSISASLLHHVWIEPILHRIRSGGANASTSRITTDDKRIHRHRYEGTSQGCSKEGAAKVLLDDNLTLSRPARFISCWEVSKLVAGVETWECIRELVLVPIPARFRIRIHDLRENKWDLVLTTVGDESVCGG